MRVEDTDATRYVPGSVEGIRHALNWAGLEYDYGPGKDGPHAPYFQSERLDLYRSYSTKLLHSGHAYRCFCSMDQLTETREKLARSGSNASYDKRCLHLTDEEVARKVRAGEKSIVRLNDSNLPQRPRGADLVFGPLKDAHASLATDPILLKSDLFPTYHLASVVDDHEMGITHVLRGEEWLPSLPLHLDLYAALKLEPPKFAHMPILLNPDRTKMSKRNGDVQVVDYIRRGWEPAAVLNWLALAGWGVRHNVDTASEEPLARSDAPDSTTILTMQQLLEQFDLLSITQRSTSLDPAKLEYINKHHLSQLSSTPEGLTSMAERVHEQIKEAFPTSQYTSIEMIKHAIQLLEGRLTNITDIPLHAPYLFQEPNLESDEAKAMLKKVKPEQRKRVLEAVNSALVACPEPWEEINFLDLLHHVGDRIHIPTGVFMKTMRHALTGLKEGPAVADIIRVLGRERTLFRL